MTGRLSGPSEAETFKTVARPVLLVELGFASGPSRVWSGLGTLSWSGQDWLGVGTLGRFPALKRRWRFGRPGPASSFPGCPPISSPTS